MKYLKRFNESNIDDENIDIIRDILRDISDNDVEVEICQVPDYLSIEIGKRDFRSFMNVSKESTHKLENYIDDLITMNDFIEKELNMFVTSINIITYHTLDGGIRSNSFKRFLEEISENSIDNIDNIEFYYTVV